MLTSQIDRYIYMKFTSNSYIHGNEKLIMYFTLAKKMILSYWKEQLSFYFLKTMLKFENMQEPVNQK